MIKQYNIIPAGYEDDYNEELDDDYFLSGAAQKLKITVVPDITTGACINGEDFDSRLSEEHAKFFESFNTQWNIYKRTPMGDQSLQMVLMHAPVPLKLALQLFANCPGCKNLKNRSLALHILETICDMCKQHPHLAANCDDNTRMVAFNFIKTCGITNLYKAVMETYALHEIRDLLVPKLKDLINEGNYKDAANWAICLDLTDRFGIYDLLFPLILQEKVHLVEDYLKACKSLQIPTIKFLDSLVNNEKSVYETAYPILEMHKYHNVTHSILKTRTWSRLVTRLSKKLNISENLTPNCNFKKACSYIHYLHRRYQGGGMSLDSWRELARDAASTKALQLDLITNIEQHGDLDEAIYWAQQFPVSLEECPRNVQLEIKQIQSKQLNSSNSSNDSDVIDAACAAAIHNPNDVGIKCYRKTAENTDFMKLDLPEECIILVNTKQKFLEMLDFLQLQSIIAFDSEWKPSARNDSIVSLLQLATKERVYLVDCLSDDITIRLWKQLGQRIFNSMDILKLGFALQHDLIMLQKTLPLQLNLQTRNCYLDLRELWTHLKSIQGIKYPYKKPSNKSGLGSLVESCLGKKLDKSNQCSNWSNRPLRRDQILYAALDAHCLLQIYEVFAVILARLNISIESISDGIINGKGYCHLNAKRVANETNNNKKSQEQPQQQKANARSATGKAKSPGNSDKLMCAADVKLICDSPLTGLTSLLRKLGIDTIEITRSDINYYIGLAQREHRYVLTLETRASCFAAVLPEKQIITLDANDDVNAWLLYVVTALNIAVEKCNYFTRCLCCNSNNFLFATQDDMQLMCSDDLMQKKQPGSANAKMAKRYDFSDRTFNLFNIDDKVIKARKTVRGKPIKLNRLKQYVLRNKDYFFICDNCGTCTWDGEHKLPAGFV